MPSLTPTSARRAGWPPMARMALSTCAENSSGDGTMGAGLTLEEDWLVGKVMQFETLRDLLIQPTMEDPITQCLLLGPELLLTQARAQSMTRLQTIALQQEASA